MVREAEENAADDKTRRELVEVRNQADNVLHSAETTVAEFGDKVSAAARKAIADDIAALKAATGNDDADATPAQIAALHTSSQTHGEAMSKPQQGVAADAAGTTARPPTTG